MKRIEASVEINAPVAEVFAFASDWQRWEGVSKFRPTTQVTRGNGTRYAYKCWVAGMTLDLETEIHEFVENVGWRGRGVDMKRRPHRTQWVFEPKGDKTRTYLYPGVRLALAASRSNSGLSFDAAGVAKNAGEFIGEFEALF